MSGVDSADGRELPVGSPSSERLPLSAVDDPEQRSLLIAMMAWLVIAMAAVGTVASLFESRNRLDVTLVYYGAVVLVVVGVFALLRRRRVAAAGWVLTLLAFTASALVPLLYGGLQGENAASYTVLVLMAGLLIDGRAAFLFAAASVAWLGFIAWLELHGKLSPGLVPYSPLNSVYAAAVAVAMTAILLRLALRALDQLRRGERQAALQRDEAMRRSYEAQKLQLVGNIAAGVAHDFNNLLSVMTSAGQVLRDEKDEAERQAVLDDLEAATSRATLMVRHLLAVGNSAHDSSPTTVVDLGVLVRSSAALLPRLLGPRIRMSVEAVDGLCVKAVRSGLEQVVLNLAVNARDAMPRGGTLTLRVSAVDREVRLEVMDTGAGMDEATRARIFEPFFTTKGTGTGLGLATVQRIVGEAGGRVTVRSTVGEGTSFLIWLPRAWEAATPLSRARSAPGPSLEARRVLLVDDDVLVLRGTRRTLEREGWEVVTVGDGDEALALLSASRFDAVVSDVSMRRVDGLGVAAACRARWPELPVVLMSGRTSHKPEVPPGVECLDKPADPHALVSLLSRLLAEPVLPGADGGPASRASLGAT